MANVVTLTDFTPTPRFDNKPWTSVTIEESATQDGEFLPIDSIALVPVDADPSNPMPRSFTTEEALYDEGWYRVIFKDADNDLQQPTEPIHNVPDETLPYLPLVSDVGALLRSRTKNGVGVEVGTFTSATRPTYQQVAELIDQAADDITAGLDSDIPEGAWRNIREAILNVAAMKVELSFFSDQVNTNRSVYPQLEKNLERLLPAVEKAVIREEEEAVSGEFGMATKPRYNFPPPQGWETRPM